MNMKLSSRIVAGLGLAALLMVSAACKQANSAGGTPQLTADQKAVDAEAAKIKGAELTKLQKGIQGATVTKADEAVSLAADKVEITLPDLPQVTAGAGVSVAWVSSDAAITVATTGNGVGKATVTHGDSAKTVTISLKFTKGDKHSEVKIATFTVEKK